VLRVVLREGDAAIADDASNNDAVQLLLLLLFLVKDIMVLVGHRLCYRRINDVTMLLRLCGMVLV
jgi:hypothetical protein